MSVGQHSDCNQDCNVADDPVYAGFFVTCVENEISRGLVVERSVTPCGQNLVQFGSRGWSA